jgi:hypothetical protein
MLLEVEEGERLSTKRFAQAKASSYVDDSMDFSKRAYTPVQCVR